MKFIIKKTLQLQGETTPVGSKSQSIRALFLSLLSEGESIIENILHSEDTQDAINICKSLGAKISVSDTKIIVHSTGLPIKPLSTEINSGNSGITTRFVMPILGLRQKTEEPIILNCGEQMRARPIKALVDALRNLGLTIKYLNHEDLLPIAISGQLSGGITDVNGLTSQFLSALLIALPCAQNNSEVKVNDLHERPYAEMTLDWLKQQNIQFNHDATDDTDTYCIQGNQRYKNFHTKISADFSSASYLIAAAALTLSEVILTGVTLSDPQGDKRLVYLLQEMGADIIIEPNRLIIHGGKPLTGIKIDANDIPDLLPTLAVIGTYAQGKTEIYNVEQARIKETDRIHSMSEGLSLLGAKIEEHHDGMSIYHSKLQGACVKGYGDHRTVMALSIAGMLADGTTIIDDAEAIDKTFPTFLKQMQELGAQIKTQND
jgi:3-phosphoshikimate 1-carboxyvinyltransferase